MKKTFFLLIVTVFCLQLTGFAQKSRVGITGGVTYSSMKIENMALDNEKSRAGFTAGLIMETPLANSKFSFQPGIHYVQKGEITNETKNTRDYVALRYAEFQFNFLYNLKGINGGLFFGAGPALAFNLPSKFVTKSGLATDKKSDDSKTEKSIVFGNDILASDIRGFDYGANVLAGYRHKKGFLVSFNYTFGLRNLAPGGDSGSSIKNACFSARIGYLFNNK